MRREKKFENVNVGDTVYFVQKLNNKFFMLPDEVVPKLQSYILKLRRVRSSTRMGGTPTIT